MIRFILGLLGGVGLTLMYGAKKAQERKEAEAKATPTEEDKVVDDKKTTPPEEAKIVAGDEPANPTT